MNDTIEKLLVQVKEISKKYDLLNKKTGGYFNIFNVAGIASKEVIICRVIKELLDPKGSHYQGTAYLELFVDFVLRMKGSFSNKDLSKTEIHYEYHIENNRRVDLMIIAPEIKIPIEVKIYARDQKAQCYDYHQFAKRSQIYYLTLDGGSPSENSTKKDKISMKPDDIRCISFRDEIITWLEECLKLPNTIRISPIREIIIQLINTFKLLTNQLEENVEMEIKELILKSSDNFKSAVMLSEALAAANDALLCKLFDRLDCEIKKIFAADRLLNQYDISKRTEKKPGIIYGISYMIKHLVVQENIDLWLRIEIYNGMLTIGYCVPVNDEWKDDAGINQTDPSDYLDGELIKDGWWAHWENFENSPNFKTKDDAFYELVDEKPFDEFIKSAIAKIESFHNMLK